MWVVSANSSFSIYITLKFLHVKSGNDDDVIIKKEVVIYFGGTYSWRTNKRDDLHLQ